MSGFLYYVEGMSGKPGLEQLVELGLGHVFDSKTDIDWRGVSAGPEGLGAGVVVWVKGTVAAGGFFPSAQEWKRVPEVLVRAAGSDAAVPVPAVCVGWPRGVMPGPLHLRRARVVPGHLVKMADGRFWQAPVARAVVQAVDGSVGWMNALEKRTRLDTERGVWVEDGVAVEYVELWRIAELFWQALREGGEAAGEGAEHALVTFDERIEYALRCLRVNYRVGPVEAEVIGLLSEAAAVEVLGAVVDLPTWVRLCADKKKLAVSGAGLNGGGVG